MNLTLYFDIASYRHAMNTMVNDLHADGVLLLKEEMRLLLRDIVHFTPPLKGHAQGRNAFKGDLFGGKKRAAKIYNVHGIFQRIGKSKLAIPKKRRHGDAETFAVRLGWEQSKVIRIWKKFWNPDASIGQMKEFHKRFQNKMTGRIGWVSQHDIGRHKVQDQMWVSNSAANAYFKLLADRVGLARAGWAAAAAAVGLRLPGWVTKHNWTALGSYQAPTPEKLEIVGVNKSTKIPNYFAKHVEPAMRARVRSLASETARLLRGGKTRRKSFANTISGQRDSGPEGGGI
jgi:hypothetical protein